MALVYVTLWVRDMSIMVVSDIMIVYHCRTLTLYDQPTKLLSANNFFLADLLYKVANPPMFLGNNSPKVYAKIYCEYIESTDQNIL